LVDCVLGAGCRHPTVGALASLRGAAAEGHPRPAGVAEVAVLRDEGKQLRAGVAAGCQDCPSGLHALNRLVLNAVPRVALVRAVDVEPVLALPRLNPKLRN